MYVKPPAKLCPGCGRYGMMAKGVHDGRYTKLVYYCPICETTADLPKDYDPMNFDRRCQL